MHGKKIFVTKPYIPDINNYFEYVSTAFASGILTNKGQLLADLEERLANYLMVKNIVCVANGTMALEVALQTYLIENSIDHSSSYKIYTTPFSFAATSSAITWVGRKLDYIDVTSQGLVNESLIPKFEEENNLLVATHIYGNLCNQVELEQKFGEQNVIYDASHCFGVHSNRPFWNHGYASTLSFHATKVFSTVEGGAIIFKSERSANLAKLLINFGIQDEQKILPFGTNAKMSELHAAYGLASLDNIDKALARRRVVAEFYNNGLTFRKFSRVIEDDGTHRSNYGYYPICFREISERDRLYDILKMNNIFARKYFYPSLCTIGYRNDQSCKMSQSLAQRILCLPIHPDLTSEDTSRIVKIVNDHDNR